MTVVSNLRNSRVAEAIMSPVDLLRLLLILRNKGLQVTSDI